MNINKPILFLYILSVLTLFTGPSHANPHASQKFACQSCHFIEVPVGAHIPHDQKTYTLFLAPSSEYKLNVENIHKLKSVFMDFGHAIGDNNVAIWLKTDDELGIDIQRSKQYSDKFDLNYNDGPYVVTTTSHPDEKGTYKAVIISLNNISAKRAIRLLNELERDIRLERESKKIPLKYEEIKQKLLSFAEENLEDLKTMAVSIFEIIINK